MSKVITEKIRAVYDFLAEKNKEACVKGKGVAPNCYAVSFDSKNQVEVLPIPLTDLQSPDERRFLLKEMAKILKTEKVRVKMFMLVTEAWVTKVNSSKEAPNPNFLPSQDPNREEVLILSGRDFFDNVNYQILEIKRDELKKVTLQDITDKKEVGVGWKKLKMVNGKNIINDTLLDTIWTEYRSSTK